MSLPLPPWAPATWADVCKGDRVLGADGHPWEVITIEPRITTHKAVVSYEGRTFVFYPDHTLPVDRIRGPLGHAVDLLASAFGPLEFVE